MNRLFVKIWLWFWLAMVLLGGTLFLLEQQLSTGFRGERLAGLVQALGDAGLTVLRHQGPEAFQDWRRGLEQRLGGRLYLLAPDGRELGGRVVPGALAKDLAAGTGQHRLRHHRHALMSRFRAADGEYTAVAVGPGRRGLSRRFGDLPAWARLAVAAVVSGGVCLGLALYVARPVRRVRAATRRLAEGDLGVRVGHAMGRRRDEMAALGHDFDAMARRLQTLLEAQRRLLQDVSHELRSPLARLRVALELARGSPERAANLDRIEREAERLDELVGQVLTLARLEAGAGGRAPEQVDLSTLVAEVVADADFLARRRDAAVSAELAEGVCLAGHPDLLRSAVDNLLRNAVAHTAPGTRVQVRLTAGQGQARLTVDDRGPGVPAQDLPRLFEPFFRVQQARERDSGGTGLGLAITRRAVEAHGGSVRAANRPQGGLEVVLSLPVKSPAAGAATG